MSTNLEMDTKRIGRRNQSWPEALKREIVAACAAPGVSVSKVAREYNVNANQVFRWRKLYSEELGSPAAASGPSLIPVTITTEPAGAMGRLAMVVAVEIELGGKYRIRVNKDVEVETLRRVVDVLERR